MTRYTLLKDRLGRKAGITVYEAASWDYGLASDDTRHTGKPHISVTEQPDGGTPTFTVPVAHLRKDGES